ncbi:MAG: hypothetical protein QM775_34995 [Pirellulales bacterium]
MTPADSLDDGARATSRRRVRRDDQRHRHARRRRLRADAPLREAEQRLGRTKTPAVALTAYARAEDRRKVLLAGFQAHIAKPVESGELLAVVASLTGRV